MFDPEKIERPYVKEWGHHAVHVVDYDQLLVLYRERVAVSDAHITAEVERMVTTLLEPLLLRGATEAEVIQAVTAYTETD